MFFFRGTIKEHFLSIIIKPYFFQIFPVWLIFNNLNKSWTSVPIVGFLLLTDEKKQLLY